jgi:hypothetical protein
VRVNERILRQTRARVEAHRGADTAVLYKRLYALCGEWDTERVVGTSTAALVTAGAAMGLFKGRRWFWLSGFAGVLLMGQALFGRHPAWALARRLGVRTPEEIEYERTLFEGLIAGYSPEKRAVERA